MNSLVVHLNGKRVGVLDDDGQRLIFRYNDAPQPSFSQPTH